MTISAFPDRPEFIIERTRPLIRSIPNFCLHSHIENGEIIAVVNKTIVGTHAIGKQMQIILSLEMYVIEFVSGDRLQIFIRLHELYTRKCTKIIAVIVEKHDRLSDFYFICHYYAFQMNCHRCLRSNNSKTQEQANLECS